MKALFLTYIRTEIHGKYMAGLNNQTELFIWYLQCAIDKTGYLQKFIPYIYMKCLNNLQENCKFLSYDQF